MKLRILTALFLIPPVIYLIGWSPKWLMLATVIAVVELTLHEFFKLCQHAGFKPLAAIGYLGGAAICLQQGVETSRPETYAAILFIALVLATLMAALVFTSDLKSYLGAVTTTVLGVLYVALTLSLLLPLRFSPLGASALGLASTASSLAGRNLMFLLFLAVWASDTFAYLAGRAVGRKKLFPVISPKKTLEGSVAGLVGTLLLAWGFGCLFWQTASLKKVMLLAGLIAVFGQIGDLAESAMKRGANLKDSGSILPGHGGLLDRLDSLLFGVPVLWLSLAVMDIWR